MNGAVSLLYIFDVSSLYLMIRNYSNSHTVTSDLYWPLSSCCRCVCCCCLQVSWWSETISEAPTRTQTHLMPVTDLCITLFVSADPIKLWSWRSLQILCQQEVMSLRCRQSNGDIITAHFFFNGSHVGNKSEFIITNVQQSDEGLYSCATDVFGESPQGFLRVRGQTMTSHPV